MTNQRDGAYALTLLCPIKNGDSDSRSYAALTRKQLHSFGLNEQSPLAKVPNTFFARFYVLNDVFFEGSPALEDHLKSRYLVFSSNFHGDLEEYLTGFWQHAEHEAKAIWQHCVGFEQVTDAASFCDYIKRCQVKTTFFFNGSSGAPLAEQLKALYLKQEFTEFAIAQQNASAAELKEAFAAFVKRTQPDNLEAPTWAPGKHDL